MEKSITDSTFMSEPNDSKVYSWDKFVIWCNSKYVDPTQVSVPLLWDCWKASHKAMSIMVLKILAGKIDISW